MVWSLCIRDEMNDEKTERWNEDPQPLPLCGRGWAAARAFTSGGGQGAPRSACRGGEGVKLVKTQSPYRRTRSLARTTEQIDNARALRQATTETERAAWHLLRGLRSSGFKFRRQHPVGPYIADFCCTELRLMVELDGGVH